MGAALADLFDESALLRDQTVQFLQQRRQKRRRHRRRNLLQRLWRRWVRLVRFLVGTGQAVGHQAWLYTRRLLWDRRADPWNELRRMAEEKSAVTGGSSSKINNNPTPRTLSWSDVAPVAQVKWVAETLSGGDDNSKNNSKRKQQSITVNDIFVSCVTAALAKQLQHHRKRLQQISSSPSDDNTQPLLPRQTHMTVAVPVHLKGGVVLPEESVGNNIGAFVIRVPGELDNDEPSSSSSPRAAASLDCRR